MFCGLAHSFAGRRIELEKNLPSKLDLNATIIFPSRSCSRQEFLAIEVLIPTASVPTEPPTPHAAEEGLGELLKSIRDDISGLRTACEGSWEHLNGQLQQNTADIAAQQRETV